MSYYDYRNYDNLFSGAEFMESVTLANGEIVETKLTDDKQEEQQIVEEPITEQGVYIEEPGKSIFEIISDFFKGILGF